MEVGTDHAAQAMPGIPVVSPHRPIGAWRRDHRPKRIWTSSPSRCAHDDKTAPLKRLALRRPTTRTLISRHQLPLLHIKLFFALDHPFVETAAAERDPFRLFGRLFLFEGEDIGHEILKEPQISCQTRVLSFRSSREILALIMCG